MFGGILEGESPSDYCIKYPGGADAQINFSIYCTHHNFSIYFTHVMKSPFTQHQFIFGKPHIVEKGMQPSINCKVKSQTYVGY